jgi:hypothetical protein
LKAILGYDVTLPFDAIVSSLNDCKVAAVSDFMNARKSIHDKMKVNMKKY